jgi:cytoskeletal protein CcmA (bactofilin family)|tara:strand:- start:138 stop:605 length:468 start_codon:yes stop_codon:yes gene_type:complete
MFKSFSAPEKKTLNHSGRSLVGETLQIEGDVKSSGSIDVAGLVNGNVFVNEMVITDTGSIRGTVEVTKVEVNGHIDGKIMADTIIIGKNAVIKGDIYFRATLKAEEGADIDGYIKRIDNGKTSLEEEVDLEEIVNAPDFKRKDRKPKVVPVKEAI